ncbi:MAG: hypothetical protein HKO92_05045 [Flavobacteriaceae bacterium]|nr:hypothetical protein [Flavobacteriaceae bacterium]
MYGFFEFVLLQLTVLIALLVNHFVLETNDLIQSIIFVNIIALLLIIIFFIKKIVQEILSINLFNLIKEIYNSIILVYKRAIHFVLTNSISIISTTILYTIIKSEYSLEALGIYDTILRFSQIVTLPLIATNGRVMTIAAKFYNQKNLKELKTYVVKITRMLMLVSSLVFAGVIVFYYLYSELYNNLLSDYWALFILLIIAQLINNWAGPVGVILQVTGNEKTFNKITLISAFYLITSTIILTKYFSITILGLNTLIYLLILNLQSLKVLKNRLNINPHSITKKNELPRTET